MHTHPSLFVILSPVQSIMIEDRRRFICSYLLVLHLISQSVYHRKQGLLAVHMRRVCLRVAIHKKVRRVEREAQILQKKKVS
jgi:hypothetical protein